MTQLRKRLQGRLEDVTPEGDVHYVTEGELRAIHRERKPTETIENPTRALPLHTYRRADAAPLIPGEVVPLIVELLPTSYQFKQGHRIRIALAGADKDFPTLGWHGTHLGSLAHTRSPIPHCTARGSLRVTNPIKLLEKHIREKLSS